MAWEGSSDGTWAEIQETLSYACIVLPRSQALFVH